MNIRTKAVSDSKIRATGAGKQRTITINPDENISRNHAEAATTLYRVLIQGERAQELGLRDASCKIEGDVSVFTFPHIKM